MSANLLFFYQKKTFYELFLIKKNKKRTNDFIKLVFYKKRKQKDRCITLISALQHSLYPPWLLRAPQHHWQ